MKIAIVSDRVYPYFKGGAEKRYWEIATRLVKKGHEVHFYTGQWPGMAPNECIEGVHLHGVYKVGQFYVNGRKSITESIKYTLALFIPLLRADYDVMDCESVPLLSMFPARLACWVKRKKLVASWHEAWGKEYWKQYLGWKWPAGASIEWIAARLPDKIIAVSDHTKKGLVQKLHANGQKIVVVTLGSDIKHISQIAPSKEKTDVLYAGRLLPHKNVDILIRAIARIKQHDKSVRCTIVGDGPDRPRLQNLAKDLGLQKNVRFTGFIKDHDHVYAKMKSSRVFALPSQREGFGIVVVEANACGIPVVTVDHEDNAAQHLITRDKNGIVCTLTEVSFAKGLEQALHKNYRNCAATVRDMDWSHVTEKIEEVYR